MEHLTCGDCEWRNKLSGECEVRHKARRVRESNYACKRFKRHRVGGVDRW